MTSSSGGFPPELPKPASPSLRSFFGSLAGEAAQPGSAGDEFLQDVRSLTSYRALRGLVDFLTICGTVLFAFGCVTCLVASIASCAREGSDIPMNPGLMGSRSLFGGPVLLILSFFSAFGTLAMQLVRRGAVLLIDMADIAIWRGRKASASGEDFLQQVRSATSYRVLRSLFGLVSTILICSLLINFLLGPFATTLSGLLSQSGVACFVLVLVSMAITFAHVLFILLVIAAKHAAILLVDMADLTVWHGSRSSKDSS